MDGVHIWTDSESLRRTALVYGGDSSKDSGPAIVLGALRLAPRSSGSAPGSSVWVLKGGTGQGGQDSLYLHFGLGDAETIDSDFLLADSDAEAADVGGLGVHLAVLALVDGVIVVEDHAGHVGLVGAQLRQDQTV